MQSTLKGMASFLKNIIPSHIPEDYPVKALLKPISDEGNIREGVRAFRDLLYIICDRLIADGSQYDKPAKSTPNNDSHPSLPVSFPFLNNIKSLLFNMGYHGQLIENGEALWLDDLSLLTAVIGADGGQMRAKITVPKLIEALNFLANCGFCFAGIDSGTRSLAMSEGASLKVTYPKNPVLLIGLKTMAIAQKDLYAKGNHDIFLRCDYRVLKDEETQANDFLKDFTAPLSNEVQNFCLELHRRYLDAGLKCTMDVFYLNVRLIYSYKSKEVWTFSAAHESGYRMLIKAQNTHKYTDMIESFPLPLQEKISRGYGCNKKLFGEPCQKGCHGFSFPLDESLLEIRQHIDAWLDKEISCMQKKR